VDLIDRYKSGQYEQVWDELAAPEIPTQQVDLLDKLQQLDRVIVVPARGFEPRTLGLTVPARPKLLGRPSSREMSHLSHASRQWARLCCQRCCIAGAANRLLTDDRVEPSLGRRGAADLPDVHGGPAWPARSDAPDLEDLALLGRNRDDEKGNPDMPLVVTVVVQHERLLISDW
jgi:hypothetical protein